MYCNPALFHLVALILQICDYFALLFKQQRDWLCVRKCPIQNVVMYFFMGILTLQVTLFFFWNTFTLKFNSIN